MTLSFCNLFFFYYSVLDLNVLTVVLGQYYFYLFIVLN